MSEEIFMTGEAGFVTKKVPSWAQMLMKELRGMKTCTEETMLNLKNCMNHLYTFMANQADSTPAGTAVSTPPSPPQESAERTTTSTLEQFMTAMKVNWTQKRRLPDPPMFEEKRMDFQPWLQQIIAKLNMNMSNNAVSVQFWYILLNIGHFTYLSHDIDLKWAHILQIDIDKCEFEIKSIKYLRLILKIKKDVQLNFQKMKAIVNWQASQSVKEV